MGNRACEIARWQNNLSMAFAGPLGIVGERVLAISDAETRHRGQAAGLLNGFTTLSDACQDFGLQTIDEAQQHQRTLNAFSFAIVIAAWRRLRVALNEFYSGYYYDAASNLRPVFESALYLGAAAHGYIRFDAIFESANRVDATKVSEAELHKQDRKVRDEIDRTIKDKMRGKSSGLSDSDQCQLDRMFIVLHAHVHKSSSSVIEFLSEMWSKQRVPPIAPTFDLNKTSEFCNVAICVAWVFTRVLPCVSLPSRFSQDWHKRYKVLDEAFRSYLQGWEKPAGPAFLRFVDSRMNFDDEAFRRFQINRVDGDQ